MSKPPESEVYLANLQIVMNAPLIPTVGRKIYGLSNVWTFFNIII